MAIITGRGTAETVQEFLSRFGAGDRAGMLELFAPDTDFHVAGSAGVPWTGRRRTAAEVDAFLRSVLEDVSTREFTLEKMVTDGPECVVLGSFAHEVKSTGKIFAGSFALRITVEDSRIRRYHMFEDSYAAALAFVA